MKIHLLEILHLTNIPDPNLSTAINLVQRRRRFWRSHQQYSINRCQIMMESKYQLGLNKRKVRTNNILKRRLIRMMTHVFLNKNDLTKVNCENDPKRVGESGLFSTCECDDGDDDDVDDVVEDLTRRNDCGAGNVKTLKSDGASIQDKNAITDKDTIFHQQIAESNVLGMMMIPEQIAHENTDKGNMTLTGLQTTENRDYLSAHDTPKIIIEADALIQQRTQVNKHATVENSSKRPPLTEEKKIKFKDNLSKTVFVTGEANMIQRLFHTKPVQMFKEISARAGGEVDQIVRTNKGLRILTKNEEQKNQILKLNNLCGHSVTVSLPYSLEKNSHENISHNKAVEFKVKGVIHGIEEEDENLKELAEAIGAVQIKRIGNPETSKTALVTFEQGMNLPPFIQAFGRRFKVHAFIPKPMRCDKCQQFGHTKFKCSRPEICSRCGENHSYELCPYRHNSEIKKCINCHGEHSAAYRGCPEYIKTQEILKIRVVQKMSYAEAATKYISESKKVVYDIDKQHSPVADTPNYSEEINNDENDFPNLSVDKTTNVPSPGENTKEFLNFNYSNHKAINVAQPKKTNSEEFDALTCKIMAFVLGVLASIDKSKDKRHAKDLICYGASDFLFEGEIQFRWKTQENNPI